MKRAHAAGAIGLVAAIVGLAALALPVAGAATFMGVFVMTLAMAVAAIVGLSMHKPAVAAFFFVAFAGLVVVSLAALALFAWGFARAQLA